MKLLIVDLDDTLVDTTSFKKKLFNSISSSYPITPDEVELTYQTLKKENHMDNWILRFQEKLSKKIGTQVIIGSLISETVGTLKVIEQVISYVKKFDGHKVLITYGDPVIQNQKIKALHLSDYIDEIFITTKKKELYLPTIIEGEHVILKEVRYHDVTLIDDEKGFLSFVQTHYRWINAINTLNLV